MSLFPKNSESLIDFVKKKGLEIPTLYVVDVGVSGGLHPAWRKWGDRLVGLGIDCWINEVKRLADQETNPLVGYVSAKAGAPQGASFNNPTGSTYSLHRSLAYLATYILSKKPDEMSEFNFVEIWRKMVSGQLSKPPVEASYSNIPQPLEDHFYQYYARRHVGREWPQMTDRTATVDDLIAESKTLSRVDLLKIDTDGMDFDVLRGSENALGGALAVEIEVQFQGQVADTANIFCNIDLFLRKKGFSLFKLAPAMYARSALPRPFLKGIPAQNETGQIMWGEALYIRYGIQSRSLEQRQNLALILDLYGLEDVAAEIMLETPGLFDGNKDEAILNFLASKVSGTKISFDELVKAFLENPIKFALNKENL